LGTQLGRATALAIAHPPNEYMDVALPVKLFDSLAAGRPVIVTPRLETAALVRHHGVGVVTAGDSIEDVATAIVETVRDDARAQALGAKARQVAEREFDWTIVGARIADAVLARTDGKR
jgi:glycosyltransferase involved in cell wall biosynthesis